MKRQVVSGLLSVLMAGLLMAVAACAAEKAPEITDPQEAAKDPDFAVQGEYAGKLAETQSGVQVIARGHGKFDVVVYSGGLPGDGWKRGEPRMFGKAELKGETIVVAVKDKDQPEEKFSAKLKDGKVIVESDGAVVAELKKVERKSATMGAKPPAGAIVLFDGTSADKFQEAGHLTDDKCLLSGVTTKDKFDSYKLHLEFRLSWMPTAGGQGRSNSGVYLHDAYEVQVLDSFGLEGVNNECGGFYKVRQPDVNMCFPPMTWQTYDIEFTAPKYEGDKKVSNARVTVIHNGVVIHKDIELPADTPGRAKEGPGPRPFHLQGHGNRVYYRNIWLEPKKS